MDNNLASNLPVPPAPSSASPQPNPVQPQPTPTPTQPQSTFVHPSKKPLNPTLLVFIGVAILGLAILVIFVIILTQSNSRPDFGPDTGQEEYTYTTDPNSPNAPSEPEAKAEFEAGEFVSALCRDEKYSVVAMSEDNRNGIFECENSHEVYSVGSIDDQKNGYGYTEAYAFYFGNTFDSTAHTYFSDSRYFFKNLHAASREDELMLLVEADSEEDLLYRYTEPLFNYIMAHLTGTRSNKIRIMLYYTDSLEDVDETLDYLLITNLTADVAFLPHGDTFGNLHLIHDDKKTAFIELTQKPEAYSAHTLKALKENRHTNLLIDTTDGLTPETLREKLQNSFLDAF